MACHCKECLLFCLFFEPQALSRELSGCSVPAAKSRRGDNCVKEQQSWLVPNDKHSSVVYHSRLISSMEHVSFLSQLVYLSSRFNRESRLPPPAESNLTRAFNKRLLTSASLFSVGGGFKTSLSVEFVNIYLAVPLCCHRG